MELGHALGVHYVLSYLRVFKNHSCVLYLKCRSRFYHYVVHVGGAEVLEEGGQRDEVKGCRAGVVLPKRCVILFVKISFPSKLSQFLFKLLKRRHLLVSGSVDKDLGPRD